MEKENNQVSEKIYRALISRKIRAKAIPSEATKELVLEKIKNKVSKNLPVKLLQAWGGCKNPNLPIDYAELCDEATLNNLNRLNEEVVKIYKPGLMIYICPGDGRVQNVNKIPEDKTEKYVKTLTAIADRYDGLFSIIPVSVLYKKYSKDFLNCLVLAECIATDVYNSAGFDELVSNAKNNIFYKDLESEKDIVERSRDAARDYVIYRVAEEEAEIFRDFDDCIRAFFIKYAPFYKKYIKDITKTKPRLDCAVTFYTGKKGNITQPWQAVGRRRGEEVLFLSQKRLNKN